MTLATVLLAGLLVGCSEAAPPGPEELTPEQADYAADVAGIDDRFATDRSSALTLGRTVCDKLAQGATVEEIAAESARFTGGESVIGPEQSRRVVEAARRHLCP